MRVFGQVLMPSLTSPQLGFGGREPEVGETRYDQLAHGFCVSCSEQSWREVAPRYQLLQVFLGPLAARLRQQLEQPRSPVSDQVSIALLEGRQITPADTTVLQLVAGGGG